MTFLERISGRFSNTQEGRVLFKIGLAVFAVSLGFKFLLLSSMYTAGGDDFILFGESKRYFAVAEEVAVGDGYYYKDNLESFRPPGYPLFFVPFIELSIPLFFAALVQIIVASLIPVFIVYLARRHLSLPEGVVLGAGLLAALEPMQVFYGSVLLPDVFFSILFLMCCVGVAEWMREPNVHHLLVAGIALGLANYMRPAGLYLLVFLVCGVATVLILNKSVTRRHVAHLVVFIAISMAVVAPWYVRNYQAFGHFAFVSMTAHLAYVYSAIAAEAASEHVSYEAKYPALMLEARKAVPNPGYLPSFENEEYLQKRAVEIISSHPKEYAVNYLLGLNTFWFSGNYHYLLSKYGFISFPAQQTSFSMILAGGGFGALFSKISELIGSGYLVVAVLGKVFWFLVVLGALVGAYILRTKPITHIFLICVVYTSVTMLLTTYGVEARHRYMLNPLLFLFFVATLHHVYEAYLNRRTRDERRRGGVRIPSQT